jgi:hypothetical protein
LQGETHGINGIPRASLSVFASYPIESSHFCQRDFVGLPKNVSCHQKVSLFGFTMVSSMLWGIPGGATMAEACSKLVLRRLMLADGAIGRAMEGLLLQILPATAGWEHVRHHLP